MINTDSYPRLDDAHLHALFQAIHDVVRQSFADVTLLIEAANLGEVAMFRSLPPTHLASYDLDFARQFAAAVVTVTWKLTEPEHIYELACRAEELALKYLIDTAEQIYRAVQPDSLPDYDLLRERLFEDDEYLRLWDEADADTEIVNPGIADWFEPFREVEQVHPFSQVDGEPFRNLWTDPGALDDVEDPETEVYLTLGEDWLDVPDDVAEKIPAILEETRRALFPEHPTWKQLSERDRTRLFDSAAEDVRLLLNKARREAGNSYEVWAITNPLSSQPAGRFRLSAAVPLAEALDLRRLARGGEYRGALNVSLRVFPADYRFDPKIPELRTPPKIEQGEHPEPL